MLKITPSTQQYLRHCYCPLIDPFSFFQGNFWEISGEISPSTSGKVTLLLTYLFIRSGFQEIQILSLHNQNFHLKSASYQLSDYEKCPDCQPFPSQNFGDSSLIDFFLYPLHYILAEQVAAKGGFHQSKNIYGYSCCS